MATDHSRAIISSLFAPPPGSTAQPPESFIAYVQTFEPIPDSQQRKPRFLILSALRDGRLKLHKAKQNANGTFSIGKTWALDDLRQVEVAKRMHQGRMHPLEFTLIVNGKTYRYETDMPSSQQAAFLVTVVRCWRRYMAGRGQPDLNLIGFSVDSPNPAASSQPSQQQRPSTASSISSSSRAPQQRPPQSASSSYDASRPAHPSQLGTGAGAGPPPLSASARSDYSQSSGPHRPSSSSSSSRQPSMASDYPRQPPPQQPPRPSNASTYSYAAPGRPDSPARRGSVAAGAPPPPGQPYGRASPAPVAGGAGIERPSSAARKGSVPPPPGRPDSRQGSASASGPSPSSSSSALNGAPVARRLAEPSGIGMGIEFGAPVGGTAASVGRASPTKQRGMLLDEPGPSQSSSSRRKSVGPAIGRPSIPSASPSSSSRPPTPLVAPTPRKPPVEDAIDDATVLSNVEEMLEGFEWRGTVGAYSGSGSGGMDGGEGRKKGRGKADEIEKRLIGELKALEAASIHAIMESDDRVTGVIKHLDDALAELDRMDLMMGLYKTQLNLMTDDIAHIESQNRGLQVQTSNQRALLAELDKLMSTIHIPETDLTALSQESLENPQGIEKLERAAVTLYKALLSTRDTAVGDMAAASERIGEYRTKASQFCKRVFDFLSIMFKFQIDQLLNPKEGTKARGQQLPSHAQMEDFLGRYCGLMLFVKEMDQGRYQMICSAYFTAMSDLHRQEIQELMSALRGQVKKATDDELEATFTARESPTIRQQSIRRAGTLVRSPLEGGRKDRDKDAKLTASEAFSRALEQILPHLSREQGFLADFLHIAPLDASITFADYMMLETFFRRGATSFLAVQARKGMLKDVRNAMELVFGWLEGEIRDWIEGVLQRDSMQIVGILATLDRFILQGEQDRNEFLMRTLQKQYQKSLAALERSCKEQIRSIEQTKLTLKKRKGVVPFVRVFPLFVARVESQLDGAEALNIRGVVNSQYERIVATMFDCLQQMAKMDGEGQGQAPGEGKDQLNYHVILIENMHHIIAVFSNKQKVPALAPFVQQAREKYDQNLAAYIRLILRRPLARVVDFFAGLEQLLRTTPPTEVSLHSAYTKSALRRTISDVRAKDLRKAIDALYKRVDKHFGNDIASPSAEHTDVLKTVWKACEDELGRLIGNWKGLVAKCYPDEKGGIEVGRTDIHNFFLNAQAA
ncbi:hypothetical protein JCM5296_002762 [Sporobolomyces johnsonii]